MDNEDSESVSGESEEYIFEPDFYRIICLIHTCKKFGCDYVDEYYIYCEDVFTYKKYIIHLYDSNEPDIMLYKYFQKNNGLYDKIFNQSPYTKIDYNCYRPKKDNQIFMTEYMKLYEDGNYGKHFEFGGDDFIYQTWDRESYYESNERVYMIEENFEKINDKSILHIFYIQPNIELIQTNLILARRKNPDLQKNMRFMIELVYQYLPN